MHTNLYAQTGHFATPTEVMAFVAIALILIAAGLLKSLFS
jgi:hypothetical protein